MTNQGFSHINLATTDIEKTREFYEDVLGFPQVIGGIYEIEEGGRLRHVYFDTGNGQLLSFIEPGDISGIPDEFETAINPAVNVPDVFYHFAFAVGSPKALAAKREELLAKGVEVTQIVDHDWCHSIYLQDPVNGLTLEYACYTRELTDEDAELAVRFEIPFTAVQSMAQT